MAVQFIDDGASIKIVVTDIEEYDYTRTVQKDETKFNVNQETGEHISIRSGKFGDQFRYSDITAPVSANITALLTTLESWLESTTPSGGGGQTVSISDRQTDAAGRVQTALPVVLADYKFIRDLLPEQFDVETNGTGSVVFDDTSGTGSALLSTSASGDWAVIQSIQRHPYFNGKAQQPEYTFINLEPETNIEKRIGYYSSSIVSPFNTTYDGMWLRSSTDGNVYLEVYRAGTEVLSVAQADWDDPLDGTGASGVTIDWANFNVALNDFLYLGGTGMTFILVLNNTPQVIHSYTHANTQPNTIVRTPIQPIRAEIRQTGAGSGTFKFICAQVTSSGDSNQIVGFPRGIAVGKDTITLSSQATSYVMIAFRLKSTYLDLTLFQEAVTTVVQAGASESHQWELRAGGALSAGSLAFADAQGGRFEVAVGDGTQIHDDNGFTIAVGGGAARDSISGAISKLRRVGSFIDGTSEIWYLILIPHNNTQNAWSAITLNEL